MARRNLVFAGFMLLITAFLVSMPGSAHNPPAVGDIACSDFDPNARSAASDVQSAAWIAQDPFNPVSSSVLFAPNGVLHCGNLEGRLTGLQLQIDRILKSGDVRPALPDGSKGSLSGARAQVYANSIAAPTFNLTAERAYARALALMIHIRLGFLTVPGGAAEAFNRIQTCLNGKLVSNQGAVAGVKLDCSSSVIRLALADAIATGFYIGFRTLPAVDFSCDEILDQAVNGNTVEARWAASKAYVFIKACGADVSDVAANGGSAELKVAAVRPLAEKLAKSGTRTGTLLAAAGTHSAVGLANAWAAGLRIEKEVDVDAVDCDPVTNTLGDLSAFSLANSFTSSPLGKASIASWARHFASDHGFTEDNGTNVCVQDRNSATLLLTIAMHVSGSQLPLISYIPTLPE